MPTRTYRAHSSEPEGDAASAIESNGETGGSPTGEPGDTASPAEPSSSAAQTASHHSEPRPADSRSRTRTIAMAAVVSALVGGAAGFGGVALFQQVLPVRDDRVGALNQHLGALETTVADLEASLQTARTDVAQTIDSTSMLSERLDSQDARLTALATKLKDRMERLKVARGVGSPVFAVATAQLRHAFYQGRPFEAELVNVYALAGEKSRASTYVHQLAEPSRQGVPSAAQLRERLQSLASQADLTIRDQAGYYTYTMSMLSFYTGLTTQPYDKEHAAMVVSRADSLLADGDVSGARLQMEQLARQFAGMFNPWFQAADRHLSAQKAIAGLSGLVVDNLQVALKKPADE